MAVNQDRPTNATGTCPVCSSVPHEVEIGFTNLRRVLDGGRPAGVLPFAGVVAKVPYAQASIPEAYQAEAISCSRDVAANTILAEHFQDDGPVLIRAPRRRNNQTRLLPCPRRALQARSSRHCSEPTCGLWVLMDGLKDSAQYMSKRTAVS
jgi:hypothetical protein